VATAEVVQSGRIDIVGSLKVASLEVEPTHEANFGGKAVLQSGRVVPQFPDLRFAAEYAEGIKK